MRPDERKDLLAMMRPLVCNRVGGYTERVEGDSSSSVELVDTSHCALIALEGLVRLADINPYVIRRRLRANGERQALRLSNIASDDARETDNRR